MQCRRCGFENMPGLSRCGRCASVLLSPGPVDVHPPRAEGPRWLRTLGYSLNRLSSSELSRRASQSMARLRPGVASVCPGLGHLLARRLRAIRWLWGAWCVFLLLGLCFYGSVLGGVLIGIALCIHAWIICDAAALCGPERSPSARILSPVLVFALLVLAVYGPVRGLAGRVVRGSYAPMDVERQGISRGDFLLVWRPAHWRGQPRHGDVVMYRVTEHYGSGYRIAGGDVMSIVIGLPGERVTIANGRAAISGPRGTEDSPFGLPKGVSGRYRFQVPPEHYLCLPPPYEAAFMHGGQPPSLESFVSATALAPRSAIRGRAFMVWNPVWRRRWLRRQPVEEGR